MKAKRDYSKGGQLPKYSSPEEMQVKIDEYFRECEGEVMTDEDGNVKVNYKGNPIYSKQPKPPTVTGLALALGFNSRQSFFDYCNNEANGKLEYQGFSDTISRAKSRVEAYAEARLFDKEGSNGAKFSLSNNFRGWAEKTEVKAQISYEDYLSNLDSGDIDY